MAQRSKDYDLIVLDWDGTVMDSLGAIVACAQHGLRDVGLPELPEEAIRSGIGLGLGPTVDRLLPDVSAAQRRAWIDAYRERWIGTYRHLPVLLDGALAALEALAAGEYLLAVATGKGRRGLQRDLDELDLGRFFLATRTVDEAPSKPHPQMLLELMNELGVRAERTLMVGDTTYDLDMARNAGVDGLGVLTGGHDREALAACRAVACLAGLGDLPGWLGGRREQPGDRE